MGRKLLLLIFKILLLYYYNTTIHQTNSIKAYESIKQVNIFTGLGDFGGNNISMDSIIDH